MQGPFRIPALKVVVPGPHAFDRTVTRRGFSALSTHLRIPFFQKIFFQKNFCTAGQSAGVRPEGQAEWQLPARRQNEGNDNSQDPKRTRTVQDCLQR
jgi:hypothetical protein